MITQKEIAERAGVSIATVSYALNGSKKISESTKEKIQKIIAETGYQSNILARSLRSRRTMLIGVVVEDIQAKHSPAIIDGINRAADEKGYQIILSNLRLISKIDSEFSHISEYSEDIGKAFGTLNGMQVDGIIYVGMHDRRIPHLVQDLETPLVYCYCYASDGGSSVCYDDRQSSMQLARRFLDAGHRNFGIITGNPDSEPCQRRLAGILDAFGEAGITLPEERILCGHWKYEPARMIAEELLSTADKPTAILALNDEMALGVRDAAMALQLEIPRDLSLSGFDNADEIQYVVPHITTVNRPLSRMGSRAVEILTDQIEREHSESISVNLTCEVIDGGSIAAPGKR